MTVLAVTQDALLNDRIRGFASLVGLVLVLITLFTKQRQDNLVWVRGKAGLKCGRLVRELAIDCTLAIVTVLLFAVGLPLCVDAARSADPFSDYGELAAAFVIVWALLVGLVVWQISIAIGTVGELKKKCRE